MARYNGGFGAGGNMQQMMRQAQKMQQEIARVQQELEEKEVTASAGGGMVTVTVTGKKEVRAIEIKPEAVDPEDVEMLQDMIIAAVNEAMHQAEEMAEQAMGRVTGGMKMGGLF